MKRLIALVFSPGVVGSIANAQSAEAFCAAAPTEILSALHGGGKTFTGVRTMPFPAPKPTTL